jgi:hypothetical protein
MCNNELDASLSSKILTLPELYKHYFPQTTSGVPDEVRRCRCVVNFVPDDGAIGLVAQALHDEVNRIFNRKVQLPVFFLVGLEGMLPGNNSER